MRRSGLSGVVWAVVGGVSLLTLLGGVVWFLSRRTLEDADRWASVGGLVLGLVVGVPGLVVSVVALRLAQRQERAVAEPLEEFAAALAVEWRRERGRRDLNELLPVGWAAATSSVVDRGVAGAELSGRVDDAADAFRRLPKGRLVVLGEPGAGKSVVAVELALGLVESREPGDPVPVVLPIASWNPAEEPTGWMARQIVRTYPALEDTSLVQGWLGNGKILPVLDGLDEMAEPAAAVRSLNRWLPRTGPLVLTCRTADYRTLIDVPVAGAAVVELAPLPSDDALAYLRDASPPRSEGKWDVVAEHVADSPDGPLAAALSTPLMTGLARAAYSRTAADPAALLALPSRDAVEEHLVERFVPSVYDDDRNALRWLRTLAWQLDPHGTPAFGWWDLSLAVSRTAFVTVVAALFVLIGVLGELFVPWPIPLYAALATGLVVGFGVILAGRQSNLPSRATLRLPTTPDELAAATRAVLVGLAASLVAGFGFSVVYGYITVVVTGDPVFDDGLVAGLAIAVTTAVPMSLVMLLTAPADLARAASPRSTLRADRLRTVLVVLTAAVSTGPLVWIGLSPVGAFVGPALGLTLWVTSAWGALGVARLAVVAKWPTRLPIRVVAFLDDAHRRGVLRQVGATYQFRHGHLQRHLAATHPYRHDRTGARSRAPVALRRVYTAMLVGGAGAGGYIYFLAFDLYSETVLTQIVALWLFPAVFGVYGLISEALLKHGETPLRAAARRVVDVRGKWTLPIMFPFLLFPWRNPLLVVLATTGGWALAVQWFMAAIFPRL